MAISAQAKKAGIAAAIFAVAGVIVLTRGGGSTKPSNQSWYYDVTSQSLFAADSGQLPPIAAPSGDGNGVVAHVFSCGTCDEAGRKVVYLETMTERGRAIMLAPDLPREPGEELEASKIAAPAEPGGPIQWVSAISPQAGAIQNRVTSLCPGSAAKPCTP